ncbi:MAG: response regulator [Myxococcales bacterium]|nr:response regulator [Myxococcales bacterium]
MRRARILVVDDEPDIRTVCRLALETLGGFDVATCSGGAEALVYLEQWPAELVLLDVMMSAGDGLSTLATLKGMAAPAPRVVMLTARAQAQEIESYLAAGADAVIEKPFDPRSLCKRIEEILARGGSPSSGL